MDSHSLDILEFGKIHQALAGLATLDGTKAAVARLVVPGTNAETIVRRRDQISEMVLLLQKDRQPPIMPLADPTPSLAHARIADSFLTGLELLQVALLLQNAANLQRFFKVHSAEAPLLNRLAAHLLIMPEMQSALARAIAEDGSVADNASPELRRIRQETATLRHRIERKLETLLRDSGLQDSFAGDRPTQRSGRLVLPMKASRWTNIGGLVHDRSQTGQTFFVEPPGTIALGNDLQNLGAAEESEVRRILLELTGKLRPHLDELQGSFETLIQIDLVHAAARLAERLNMTPAAICEDGEPLELVDARHPILQAALEAENRKAQLEPMQKTNVARPPSGVKPDEVAQPGAAVPHRPDESAQPGAAVPHSARQLVPLSLKIEPDLRVLAITGSNTGGKTVALKTVGLLALMAQSGLHVPARRARLPILDQVLVDIGDEQSIEQSLSTFSGHMARIIDILGRAGERSLVLLDELGSGTDPSEGGALACAILQCLAERRATSLVTTHLREVKIYCDEQPGMQNAAMEFDMVSLRPTFRLVQGEPGQSHALAIARRLGLPEAVFQRAEGFLTDEHLNLERLLARLAEERRQLREELEIAQKERAAATGEREKLQTDLAALKKERKAMLQEAYRQASGIVDNTRREMQQVLREAQGQGLAAPQVESLRAKVRQKKEAIAKGGGELHERVRPKVRPEALRVGQTVYVETFRANGTVESINVRKARATVSVGGLSVEVKVADLSLPAEQAAEAGEEKAKAHTTITRTTTDVPLELNLIGMRVAEGLGHLERFIDQSSMAGYSQVMIIHGRGTGAMMTAVREHLKAHPLVESFRSGNEAEGGIAVTVAKLKE